MIFNSFAFLFFLPIVFAIYWSTPDKYKWIIVFVSSYCFYMGWNVKYVFIIFFVTVISFFAAIYIEKSESKSQKKIVLVATVFLFIGILLYFKYFNFLSESFSRLLGAFRIRKKTRIIDVLLPVGISFYIFQAMGYVIDTYRGEVKAEKHFGYYAAFISFFPQLVAGPIERTNNLLPQIKSKHIFNYQNATYGLKLMAWGYFKKLVIADALSIYTGRVFSFPQKYEGFTFVLVIFMFTVQIYCDFSGYSDIAIGVAKLFNINLMTNFKSPYYSQSIKEFWGRWHISLSKWFRDYIYIPLGGNRVSRVRHIFNLMLTFLVSGLWHGAKWTFVIWGGLFGILQVVEDASFNKNQLKSTGILRILRTIVIFGLCAGLWVFFASDSLSSAIYVFKNILNGILSPMHYFVKGFTRLKIKTSDLITICLSMILLSIYDYVSLKKDVIEAISSKSIILRWTIYILFVLFCFFGITVTDSTEFIYFQF